jgi:acetyltransferase-like isoleucine patch superfamily enzyme
VNAFDSFFRAKASFRFLVMAAASLLPSFLRVFVLRRLGARIGRGTTIYPLALLVADEIEIGDDCRILPFAVVLNLKRFRIGHRCLIHWGSQISGHGQGSFTMGSFGCVGLQALVNCTDDVTIGRYSVLGPRSVVYTHGSYLATLRGYPNRFGPVRIGSSSWLNLGAMVLPGVSIGSNTVVKSGCVVWRDVGDDRVVSWDPKTVVEASIDSIRSPVDAAFVERWYESLFDDLEKHMGGPAAARVERLGPGRWRIGVAGGALEVAVLGEGAERPSAAGPSLLLLRASADGTKQRLAELNWIDFDSNEYNVVRDGGLIEPLFGYFELRRGMHLTRFAPRPGVTN